MQWPHAMAEAEEMLGILATDCADFTDGKGRDVRPARPGNVASGPLDEKTLDPDRECYAMLDLQMPSFIRGDEDKPAEDLF